MKKGTLFLLLFLTVFVDVSARRVKTTPQIPILAWYSIPPGDYLTLERFRELRECGFTYSFSHIYKLDDALLALDLCAKTGLKSVFTCNELESDPEGTVSRVRKHPGLGAYFLRDEPGNDAMDALGEWARRIEAVDSKHPCYLNLLPVHAFPGDWYAEHLRLFNEKVRLPQLSYDHYPILQSGDTVVLNPAFYKNLELISAEARRVGIPFWAFALSTAHTPYPVPRLCHLRLQLYADLAYGAQMLQYFTYWNPGTETWNFHQAPITQDGRRSGVYELVREMNQELQHRAFVFVGSHVESVYHMGQSIPEGTTPLPSMPDHFRQLDTHGGQALISTISNQGHRYYVIQNTSPTRLLQLDLLTDDRLQLIRRDGTQQPAHLYGPYFELEPGDVLIFSCKA